MRRLLIAAAAVIAFGTFGAFGGVAQAAPPLKPTFSKAAAFDVSKPLRDMTAINRTGFEFGDDDEEEGPEAPVGDTAHTTDGALQSAPVNASIPAPLFTFEGASNQDNFNIFGFRVNPPDTNMDVGPDADRRDDQPRVRRVRQVRQRAARPGRHRHALGGLRRSRTAPIRPATRWCCTTRPPTAGS